MNRLARIFEESDDPVLAELRRRVQERQPHQPQLGDPDYLSPEQVARILKEREEDDAR